MTRNQLLSAVTVTSSGNTPAFSISDQLTGCVTLNISSASGTTPLLSMWLQESDDGGTTWFDVTSVLVQKGATSKTEGTVTTQKRNICLDADAAATYRAVYDALTGDYYRLKYEVSGTSPQFVVSATLQTK